MHHAHGGWLGVACTSGERTEQAIEKHIFSQNHEHKQMHVSAHYQPIAKQQAQQSSLQDSYLRHGTANVSELDSLSLTMEWTWCEKEQSSSQSTVRP